MHRRTLLRSAMGATVLAALGNRPDGSPSGGMDLDVNGLLYDKETPTGGNPKGDITIVTFFDYNCPYCRTSGATLADVVAKDGKIRLIYKDWPILKASSVTAARLALASARQGRYEAAHGALMALAPRSMTEDGMRAALKAAGIDMKRLDADLKQHGAAINATIRRTNDQANALQLPGTPVYLVGPFKVASALDYQGFVDVIHDARDRAAAQ